MGVGMAYVGEAWHTNAVREREVELLYVGNQYRKAIERYYKGGPAQYPRSLADLTKDPRKPGIERYLRRFYPDPVTGSNEWGIVKAPDGGVMGVFSLSEAKPLKRANFKVVDRDFEKAEKYADWKFVFLPPAAATPLPGAKPVPGAPGTTVTPAPAQALPGSALPGGTTTPAGSTGSSFFGSGSSALLPGSSAPSSTSGSGSLLPGSPSTPAPASTQPFLTIQPTPSSPSPTPAQPFTSMQPVPGSTETR